jgi:hypothetical protein
MTETMKYQNLSTLPQEEAPVLSLRRPVLARRYDRVLSHMALWGRVLSKVQSNLSSGALRRSR